jgi:hypothetical protein
MWSNNMTESITWAFLSEAISGFWVMFRPSIPQPLRVNRKICLLLLTVWISSWLVARNAGHNVILENIFGILGWVALIAFLGSSLLLGTRFEAWKKAIAPRDKTHPDGRASGAADALDVIQQNNGVM